MAEERYDELHFTMVNGDKHYKRVPAGQGTEIYSDVAETGWVDVDGPGEDATRIRRAEIVSITLRKNIHA
jgi:hypothetical protein